MAEIGVLVCSGITTGSSFFGDKTYGVFAGIAIYLFVEESGASCLFQSSFGNMLSS